jgi:thioesterase domain-containing protein
MAALSRYTPKPYHAEALLLLASEPTPRPHEQWRSLCPQLRVAAIPGDHYSMLREPGVDRLADYLGRYLSKDSGKRLVDSVLRE